MKHAGTKTIETARLILRRLELTDAEMMFRNWTGDDKVTRFLRWDAHTTIDDTKNMIQQWVDNYQYDSTYYWGMYLKKGTDFACWQPPHSEQFPIEKNSEMIGSIGVTITSEYDFKGELGYKIGSHWWNQGYASEAAEAVINYMFHNTDIERISAFCSVENPASGKVMEKIGMRYEGLMRHYYKTRDGFHDCALYGIIRSQATRAQSPSEVI
ncbi:MAG: GNAT family N-acetyltransferase [Lachnospiraceae bacterium]|nr:GNAT family N-acetyltransferase [Lachnospiraceae bacterium]